MKLYQKISRLNEVHQVNAQLQSEFDLDKIYNSIVEAAGRLTNCAAGVLWVLRGDRIYPVCSSDESVAAQLPQEGMSLEQTGIVVNCVKNKRVERVDDVWKDRRVKSIKGKAHFESVLVVPLLSRDKVVGVITCYGTRPYVFTAEQTEWVTVLATQVGVIIENANLYQELQEATLRDPGTGLYNYRYFYQELKRRMQMAKEQKRALSIVIIDIDHFKKYNDTYGHVVGDEVLRQTGQVIQKTVGNRGVVARYGGEEFAVILDEPLEEAKLSVEHLRRAVAHNKFEYQGYVVQGVTISVGLATYPDHDQDEKELLEKADQAMYWGAKQRGRNKVAVYTPDFDAHLFVDQLTGLYTYHYLHMKMMDEYTSVSKESGSQFGLIFFNVIEFDNINRTFGFEIGNHVLREISVLIKQSVRHGEIASRYGGDEFLLLVPSVDRVEADRIRERIVKAITQHPFRVRDNVIVRVMMRSDIMIYPDEVAEEPQLISMIPETFLHLSSEWTEKETERVDTSS
nr:sensor domain-containing diguanylate cyclase [Tumebacillus amylolyticus]